MRLRENQIMKTNASLQIRRGASPVTVKHGAVAEDRSFDLMTELL